MKRLMIIVLMFGLGTSGCFVLGYSTYSWHQKMTLEVEADGKLYAGSSVVKMSVTGIPEYMQLLRAARRLDLHGEAVVLALPQKRYLFALLTYNAFLASKVFQDKMDGSLSEPGERWARIISQLRETREIAPKDYPLLVTFTDINDPKTVQKVDPDNLAATFGPGVALKRITLEITDEPVTAGKVEKVLPCLRSGKACVPLNRKLPYGDPMSNILNNAFWRPK